MPVNVLFRHEGGVYAIDVHTFRRLVAEKVIRKVVDEYRSPIYRSEVDHNPEEKNNARPSSGAARATDPDARSVDQ